MFRSLAFLLLLLKPALESVNLKNRADIGFVVINDLAKGYSEAIASVYLVLEYETDKMYAASTKRTLLRDELPQEKKFERFSMHLDNTDPTLKISNATLMVQWKKGDRPYCDLKESFKPEHRSVPPFYEDIVLRLSHFPIERCEFR